MYVYGCDPGLSGAVAWVRMDRAGDVFDVPVVDGHLDLGALHSGLMDLGTSGCLYIERAQAMSKGGVTQGVASTAKYMECYGATYGLAAGRGYRIVKVGAREWQKWYGWSGKTARATRKERSMAKARELFPDLKDKLKRKKDEHRAEALLIAWYGVNMEMGVKHE